MRICLSLDNYDRASGGASLAARGLAHYLESLGHQITVLQSGHDSRWRRSHYLDGTIDVHTRSLKRPHLRRNHGRDTLDWNRQWSKVVDDYLDANPTDLLITQNRLLYSSVDAAARHHVPSLVWAHAYKMFCADQFLHRDPLGDCSGDCAHCLRGPFAEASRENREAYRRALEKADMVMANSEYMQRVIRHVNGRDSVVVYPTFDLNGWRQEGAPGRRQVLFIKPKEEKGLSIFLEIARQMPDTQFLAAGKTKGAARIALAKLNNVRRIEWSNQMRGIYAESRILLGPSIWPEPFGRVFVEAAAAGIPSVTSNRGGIPEAVGEGGILIEDIDNIDNWLDALQSLDAADEYATLSNRARHHATNFNSEKVGKVLRNAILCATGLDLHDGAERN